MKISTFQRSRTSLILTLALLPFFLVFDTKADTSRVIADGGDGVPARPPAVEGAEKDDKALGNKPSFPADDDQTEEDSCLPAHQEAEEPIPSAGGRGDRQAQTLTEKVLGYMKEIGELESDFRWKPFIHGLTSFVQWKPSIQGLTSFVQKTRNQVIDCRWNNLLPWLPLPIILITIWLLGKFFFNPVQDFTSTERLEAGFPSTSYIPGESMHDMRSKDSKRLIIQARKILASLVYLIPPLLSLIAWGWIAFLIVAFIMFIPTMLILSDSNGGNAEDGEGTGKPTGPARGTNRDQKTAEKDGGWFEKVFNFIVVADIIAPIIILSCYGWIALLKTLAVEIWFFFFLCFWLPNSSNTDP